MKKLIINLTPTGMIPTKEITPYVPQTPAEIIKDVLVCLKLGVSMVHLHARDEEGKPTYKKEIYRQIIEGIREHNKDLVLIVSTSGRTYDEFEKRSEVLELEGNSKPDMASLTLSSINFNKIASINSPEMILRLAEKMQNRGIKPELEVFDLGMVNYAHYLIKKGMLEAPYYFNIILGNIAAAQAKLLHLGTIISELPDSSFWSVGGVGDFQSRATALGIIMGDGVRIGLEDNIWQDEQRTTLATNYSLVEKIAVITKALNMEIATPLETRKMLRL